MAHTSPPHKRKFFIVILSLTLVTSIALCAIPFLALLGGNTTAAVVETLTGETPQAKIEQYVHALARGDQAQALALWELPTWQLPNDTLPQLRARRQNVTHELYQLAHSVKFRIRAVEWWGTCCEPHVIQSPPDAGGARVRVEFMDANQKPRIYVFDLFTREQPYWGAALNYPPRQWMIRDIYPETQTPLFWTFIASQ